MFCMSVQGVHTHANTITSGFAFSMSILAMAMPLSDVRSYPDSMVIGCHVSQPRCMAIMVTIMVHVQISMMLSLRRFFSVTSTCQVVCGDGLSFAPSSKASMASLTFPKSFFLVPFLIVTMSASCTKDGTSLFSDSLMVS